MLDVSLRKQIGPLLIDVAFQAGACVTVLFGASGAGKSSILNMISGLLAADQGSVQLDGTELTNLPPERRCIGHVFQDGLLFPHLTVRGNLLFGAKDDSQLDEIVDLMGLEGLLDRRPRTLSGGEGQRVALARALLRRPNLLLMDEPMASLDESRKERLLPYLKQIRRTSGIPIIYVTHSVDEAFRLGDHIILIEDGRLIDQGAPEDMFAPSQLGPSRGLPGGGVISGRVIRHHPQDRLTEIEIAGDPVFVAEVPPDVGEIVRLRLDASDIALSQHQPEGLSILNRLQTRIAGMATDPSGTVLLMLRLKDGQHLSARVTSRAAREMKLAEGQSVYALFKAVSLTSAQLD